MTLASTAFGQSAVINPGSPYLRAPIKHLINLNKAADNTGVGTHLQRIANFTYSTSGAGSSIGVHSTGVYLPAKAVITRSYFRVGSAFTDSGAGTVALSCEDAGNIKPAVDFTAFTAGSFQDGSTTGAIATFVGASTSNEISATCEITATVAGFIQSTGNLRGWIEYIVRD